MDDLDHLLRPDIARAAEDAAAPPDFATIQRRGGSRRRTRTRITLTVAVVALVAVLGSIQRIAVRQVLPAAPPSTLRSMPAGDTRDPIPVPIESGTYLIPRSAWSVTDFTVTFPQGWTVQYGHIFARHSDQKDAFGFYAVVVDEIYANACQGERGPVKRVGPGSANLVTALLAQPGADVTGPVATTLGGRQATRVDLRVPKDLDLTACTYPGQGLQIWHSAPVDDHFVLLPDGTASVYVLDVSGKRQVFLTQYRAGTTAPDRAQLQSVLDSIRLM